MPYGQRSFDEHRAANDSLGDWDSNLYWDTSGPEHLRFFQRTFAEWQQTGLDRNSRIADPGFVNPARANFRLTRNSAALQVGFQPIRFTGVGLYGDSGWTRECRHEDCQLKPLPAPPAASKPNIH